MRQDSQNLIDYLAKVEDDVSVQLDRLHVQRELEKGDLPGHDFRGNQYTGGDGGGPHPDRQHMNLDHHSLGSLKRAWIKASNEGKDQFSWQGHQLVTNYAKYLIQYAEQKLGVANVGQHVQGKPGSMHSGVSGKVVRQEHGSNLGHSPGVIVDTGAAESRFIPHGSYSISGGK